MSEEWEYKLADVPEGESSKIAEALTLEGRDGWRLCAVHSLNHPSWDRIFFVLARPIRNERTVREILGAHRSESTEAAALSFVTRAADGICVDPECAKRSEGLEEEIDALVIAAAELLGKVLAARRTTPTRPEEMGTYLGEVARARRTMDYESFGGSFSWQERSAILDAYHRVVLEKEKRT